MEQQQLATGPSLPKSIATGAIGFGLVSLCVFATVAFGEGWMYRTLGDLGSYLIWTLLFIILSDAVFSTLVADRSRLSRFHLLFGVAFFAYAAAWILAYFSLGRGAGEFVGSFIGSILMGIVLAAGFNALPATLKVAVVLFISNVIGYFVGSSLFFQLPEPTGMLVFGIVYGVFFGTGIGVALYLVQKHSQ